MKIETTVSQTVGMHKSGLPMTGFATITTDYADHNHDQSWEELDTDDRDWWERVIVAIHESRVRLAEASPEVREIVEREAQYGWDGDIDAEADWLNGLIDQAEAEAE